MLSGIVKRVFRKLTVRYSIVFLLFLSNTYMISFRLCMSVAIVAMTSKPKKPFHENFTDLLDHCPEIHDGNSTNEDGMVKEFHWTNYEQGIILSAYFYGFLVTQLLGGILCQKWSAKHTMTISLAVSGVLSLLNPLAARQGGYVVFISVRVLVGLFSGCILSVCYSYVGAWIPIRNRSWATSITYCGINFGSIVSIGISGWISNLKENEGGWPYIFYLFGVLALLHIPLWLVTAYDHPEEHPFISDEELEYLNQEIESTHGKSTHYDIPWMKIITSVPFIALSVANFGHNWILDFLQLQIPTYMSQALNYNIKTNALLSATPFILKTLLNCLSGALSDFIYRRFNCSTNFLRKLFNTVSFYGSAIFIFSVPLSKCDGPLSVGLLCGATLFSGMCSAGFLCTYVDICSELSAIMLGLSNTIGNIAGLIAPHLVGYITNEGSSLSQWRIAFYLTSGVFVVTGTFFLIFGSSEDQNYLGLRNKEESPLALTVEKPERYARDNLGADLTL